MWCPTCQADMATELSADDRRLNCARCGGELGQSVTATLRRQPAPTSAASLDAAALLARWSAEDQWHRADAAESEPSPVTELEIPAFRYTAQPVEATAHASDASPDGMADRSQTARPRPTGTTRNRAAGGGSWLNVFGQLAAYAGTLLLTSGTVVVVVGVYQDATRHAVSGWLMAAIGQMLLLLGIVTIVTTSLEQAQQRFQKGVDRLERRLRRLEASDSQRTRRGTGEASRRAGTARRRDAA